MKNERYIVMRWAGTMIAMVIIFLLSPLHSLAQVKVESRISSMEMLIGQQVKVDVSVTCKPSAQVVFPQTADIPQGIEFLGAIDNPDEKAADGLLLRSRSYVFTSFDDTLYYIPPMTVSVDGKDYKTNQLALKVLNVEIDTLHLDQYRPAHDIQQNPFLWADWSMPFWLSVLMLVLLAAAYYLYLRLRDNKPVIASLRIVKRLLPHQKAMKAIEDIKAEHIASSENPKEYYTRLTEALRRYIEERYGFSAMEMTSSEIIDRLMQSGDQTMLDELRQLFQTADLVKFAKYSTLINENDANLVSAIDFINQTKLELPPEEVEQKPQLTAEEQRSQKSRRVLKASIAVLATVGAIIFCYVVVSLYQLLS